MSGKIQPFSSLLKLKANQQFVWGEAQQKVLEEIKQYLTSPPVLVPPQKHKLFKLYLSADERAIGSTLIQEFEGKERVIYFVSKRLLNAETRYSPIERLCLCLYFSCTMHRHYLLSVECVVVKSKGHREHIADLHKALECTRKHGLKMNPNKCAFGVSAGQFLGFMVHERGIEISQKDIATINKVVALETKVELQSLIGNIIF